MVGACGGGCVACCLSPTPSHSLVVYVSFSLSLSYADYYRSDVLPVFFHHPLQVSTQKKKRLLALSSSPNRIAERISTVHCESFYPRSSETVSDDSPMSDGNKQPR